MLRVGIVGCGTIAQRRHIPEFAANPNCKLTAFWSYTPGKAEKLAQQYGGTGYTDLDAFLDSGLDAIAVCSTNATHAEITVKALDKGIHVLCEKPMATTLEECQAMLDAAKRNGKKLMIALSLNVSQDSLSFSISTSLYGCLIFFVHLIAPMFAHGFRSNRPSFHSQPKKELKTVLVPSIVLSPIPLDFSRIR